MRCSAYTFSIKKISQRRGNLRAFLLRTEVTRRSLLFSLSLPFPTSQVRKKNHISTVSYILFIITFFSHPNQRRKRKQRDTASENRERERQVESRKVKRASNEGEQRGCEFMHARGKEEDSRRIKKMEERRERSRGDDGLKGRFGS